MSTGDLCLRRTGARSRARCRRLLPTPLKSLPVGVLRYRPCARWTTWSMLTCASMELGTGKAAGQKNRGYINRCRRGSPDLRAVESRLGAGLLEARSWAPTHAFLQQHIKHALHSPGVDPPVL